MECNVESTRELAPCAPLEVLSIRFSDSEVQEFYATHGKEKSSLRVGQAFCNYFKLHRSTEGTILESHLYEKDGQEARNLIAQFTDYTS